ncbi:3-methyl-2-oxobutanoate hydroxymethyltransferase [Candidatus Kinetoplastidibacterium crithidiae]|uniref:3-methyl-2-oxobutanoate hydroxymethyltransferase n=1 Tax=Candidatus Kinetoplastidibacterium crithidiae TCC036E TaxID=1208918 RepID=M1L5R3_9PROT|nr:3-methyl-2-oxobutanoate hydroxymethyltransferase [Candidatus Kinetoplastibacterium crithidii]AFZ82973.1 3-methyl-2-oxobutanoate hydroxymethyltransferase [Candidatus Kinetoplastibacterium crithidii (ex Angomonas deanei ATCC 30255)]AGF47973.1 3-methyl-2-oxobutanoate hydroxymethyltransferase [Candidatus Kinetoplastibacterium crithidii TCC036E]
MSAQILRKNIIFIKNCKRKQKIVALSAYTSSIASIIDKHVDLILVGDSLGMVIYGFPNTLSVTLDMMIAHGSAVVRSTKLACTVVDMPFGSYQASKSQAFKNASKILSETGAQAVKIEGGSEMAETVSFLTNRGIPVMGHIGLMPQQFNTVGGFKALKSEDHVFKKILEDATLLESAGAFAIVLECVSEVIGESISNKLDIPIVGIGASPSCDGQILVVDDILGMQKNFSPKFVKKYANMEEQISQAVEKYSLEVKEGIFPAKEYCFS